MKSINPEEIIRKLEELNSKVDELKRGYINGKEFPVTHSSGN